MKKTEVLFFLLAAFILNCCKKSNSSQAPSIVGNWVISDISGTYAYQSNPVAPLSTTVYSYSGNVLKETDTGKLSLVTVNNEAWAFNNDGTVSIIENYQSSTATAPVIDTIKGWWDYTGNTVPNSSVVLRTITTPGIVPIGSTFIVQSVSSTQLILAADEYSTSSAGATTNRNLTLTFIRQ